MGLSQTTDRFNGVVASLAIKVPCKAVAIANSSLVGSQNVNGVAVTGGDRVLCVAQTDPVANGIYVVDSTSAWARAPDMDGNRDITTDSIVVCNRSGVQSPIVYYMTSAVPLIIGEDANDWEVLIDPDVAGGIIPTHTGEVTGDTDLSLDVTAITNQTDVVADSADDVAIHDDSDGLIKKVNLSSITDGGYF